MRSLRALMYRQEIRGGPIRLQGSFNLQAPGSTDRPSRQDFGIIAVFFKSGVSLNILNVERRWAGAFRRYGLHDPAQGYDDTARRSRRGLWVGTFKTPWEWRASNR